MPKLIIHEAGPYEEEFDGVILPSCIVHFLRKGDFCVISEVEALEAWEFVQKLRQSEKIRYLPKKNAYRIVKKLEELGVRFREPHQNEKKVAQLYTEEDVVAFLKVVPISDLYLSERAELQLSEYGVKSLYDLTTIGAYEFKYSGAIVGERQAQEIFLKMRELGLELDYTKGLLPGIKKTKYESLDVSRIVDKLMEYKNKASHSNEG